MLTMRKAQELDVVELIEDLPEFGLKEGEIGAVVVAFDHPDEAYDLEFVDESGKSRFAFAVKPNQIRSVNETARRALERGIKLHNEGNGAEAQKEFRLAIELNASLVEELHDRIVKSFESQGNFEEMETFERFAFAMRLILRLQPDYKIARKNLSVAFEHQGVLEARRGNLYVAIVKFRIAIAIDESLKAEPPEVAAHIRSNLATAWIQLGIQAYQKDGFEEVVNCMALAYEADPNERTKCVFAMAYACLASSWLDQNKLEASRECLQLAYDIYGVVSENDEPLGCDASALGRAIVSFLDKGTLDFSIDLQTKQMQVHVPQVERQEYKTAA
jgi:tetratricopeptide (TPR) repeat protein